MPMAARCYRVCTIITSISPPRRLRRNRWSAGRLRWHRKRSWQSASQCPEVAGFAEFFTMRASWDCPMQRRLTPCNRPALCVSSTARAGCGCSILPGSIWCSKALPHRPGWSVKTGTLPGVCLMRMTGCAPLWQVRLPASLQYQRSLLHMASPASPICHRATIR